MLRVKEVGDHIIVNNCKRFILHKKMICDIKKIIPWTTIKFREKRQVDERELIFLSFTFEKSVESIFEIFGIGIEKKK